MISCSSKPQQQDDLTSFKEYLENVNRCEAESSRYALHILQTDHA